ncbi:hypothetical protein ACHAPC_000968 [Botrytis cinerea]
MDSGVKQVTDFIPLAKTGKEVEEESRASGSQQQVHRHATTDNVEDRNMPDPVQVNYFKVIFDSNVDLRRYKIKLDQINSKDVVKRMWVSDYSKYIVSVGKLYKTFANVPGATVEVFHDRRGRDQSMVPMRSLIIYEGPFQANALNTHVSSINSSFIPDAELGMMDIMSWLRINGYKAQNAAFFDRFHAANGFYSTVDGVIPYNQVPSRGKPTFLIITGFYTSMQPAPVVAESAIDKVAALSAPENIQYFYNILKKAFLKY